MSGYPDSSPGGNSAPMNTFSQGQGGYSTDRNNNVGPASGHHNNNLTAVAQDPHWHNEFPLVSIIPSHILRQELWLRQLPEYPAFASVGPQSSYHQMLYRPTPPPPPPPPGPRGGVIQGRLNPETAPWQPAVYPSIATVAQQISNDANALPPSLADLRTLETPPSRVEPLTLPAIEYSLEYMASLRGLVQSQEDLQANGYILKNLTQSELEKKKKCKHCNKPMLGRRPNGRGDETSKTEGAKDDVVQESPSLPSGIGIASDPKPIQAPKFLCKYHNGQVIKKNWSCCGNPAISGKPCVENEFHIPRQYQQGELESQWEYRATPAGQILYSPRPAVAIDCEMGISKQGDSELIRVTLIDYFSSEVLVDSLVSPDVEMRDYVTRYSGVTKRDMEIARNTRNCFFGRDNARMAVWRFVGPYTIVVGHSANNDLSALRWIHPLVVDTFLIEYIPHKKAVKAKIEQEHKEAKAKVEQEQKDANAKAEQDQKDSSDKAAQGKSEAEPSSAATPLKSPTVTEECVEEEKPPQKKAKMPQSGGPMSLKFLTKTRLGRDIQMRGNRGHDSLEDAIATRDLAHWTVVNGNSLRAGGGQ
ncbi:uncharacterized protein BP5553_10210 [Venustampulla echinocandica]|uniref:Exonuclease domain-containing protein n=1 Tax=Venustampulla echinocandica TaxID=2656787 RepID=A0A370T9M7_9HELO|nr:uncharacterized protein BP5553_10210 [Venustampulla echinocandica]RDL30332.1 hypothetical protein BP5553_10210 [Venustampulla echinocandica]